jgi:hypothetical protein
MFAGRRLLDGILLQFLCVQDRDKESKNEVINYLVASMLVYYISMNGDVVLVCVWAKTVVTS